MKKKKCQNDNESNIHLLSTEDIDRYINNHKKWWHIAKLQHFEKLIPVLVKDNKLRYYFSLAIGKLRNTLKDEQLMNEIQNSTVASRLRRESEKTESGDIYGLPRFFRYGEGGRSKKKE